MEVEGCSSFVEEHTPAAMLARESPWLASKSPARAVFVFGEPTCVTNLFVRNAGSSHVEVDAMVEGDAGHWATLLCSAQLLNEKRDLFLARFFADQLSRQLQDARIVKLRVTVSSDLSCFGLVAFAVNVDEHERQRLRDAGAGRAPELLVALGATTAVPVAPAPAVVDKNPPAAKVAEKKTTKPVTAAASAAAPPPSKKVARVEIDLEDEVEDVEEFDFAPVAKKIKSKPPLEKAKTASSNDRKTILKGVVFGLSGLENPERSNIRDLAVGMGASYVHNWSKEATHLLLACAGTPKHKEQQASNHGLAVLYNWVVECDRQGRRVAENDFLLLGSSKKKTSPPPPSDVSLLPRKASSFVQTFPSLDEIQILDDDDVPAAAAADDGIFPRLPDFLAGVIAWIDVRDAGVAEELKRKIIAFGGRVKTDSPAGCSHFVTDKDAGGVPGARTVTVAYIDACCEQETLLL